MIEIKTKKPEIGYDFKGQGKITFLCPNEKLNAINDLKDEKDYILTIKEYKKKRSLDSNAYAWLLMGELAKVLKTDNWSVYLNMLERYGVYTFIVVKPAVVERVKSEWRLVKELGEVTINGVKGIQLQCFFGSHTYNTGEMARLIDGIVSECKEVGIDTRTPEEIAVMNEQWGK